MHPLVRAPRGWQRVNATLGRIGAFAIIEWQKLQHDRTELLTRMVQPALWLLVFGNTFSHLHVIDTGSASYLAFLAPGIIAQSALFTSIFYGIRIIWDRDAGVLAKLMVTPAPASALITGKAFAAGVRSVAQIVGVMALSYLMGVGLTANPLRILAAMAVVMLGAAFFACLSMTLAGLVRSRDRLMGIGQAITMPLFFASNVLYPVAVMPAWLRALSTVNPLSYEVNALRALFIGTQFDPVDMAVLVVSAVVGIATASTLLRRLVAGPDQRTVRCDLTETIPRRGPIVSQPRHQTPAATAQLRPPTVFHSPENGFDRALRQMKVGMGRELCRSSKKYGSCVA